MQRPTHGPAHVVNRVDHPNPQFKRHDRIDVGSQAGNVTAPAGAGQVRPCDPHAGTSHPARVDGITQRDVGEGTERAYITHRGETGQQRVPCVAHPRQHLLGTGPCQQFGVPVAAVGLADQVSVAVDHAGQHRVARQVHGSGTFGRGIASSDNTGDALARDDYGTVPQQVPGHHIEQQAGPDYRTRRTGHAAV